jgi:hypothetical protein
VFLAAATAVGTAGCLSQIGGDEESSSTQDDPVRTDPTAQRSPAATEATAEATTQETTTATAAPETTNDKQTDTAATPSDAAARATTDTEGQGDYDDMFTGDHFKLPSSYDEWTSLGEIDVKGGGIPLYDLNGNGKAAYLEFDTDIYEALGEQYVTDETVENIDLRYPGGQIRFNETVRDSENYADEEWRQVVEPLIGEPLEILPFNLNGYFPRKPDFEGPTGRGNEGFHGVSPDFDGFLTTISFFPQNTQPLLFGINDKEHNGKFTVGNYSKL